MYEAITMPDESMNTSPDHHKRPAEIKIHPLSPDFKKPKLDQSPPFEFGRVCLSSSTSIESNQTLMLIDRLSV